MVPFLTSPLALLALIGVPALIAIYWFQRRFKTLEVSSLILWDAVKQPSMGGRTRERLRLPLPFWLEALAIALLALAAAGPFLARWSRARPLAIVCDDSLSMRGSRERAIAFVEAELKRRKYAPVRVIFAGPTPQLGELSQWSCTAASADLDAAIAIATQAAGPSGLVLVLTDRAPEEAIEPGRIRWEAFGKPAPNLAFVAATRTGDRALVEIANYGDKPATAHGKTIAPKTRQRLELSVPAGKFEMTLPNDAADFDNRITLLPDVQRPLRVSVKDKDLEGVLRATNRVAITDINPELVVDGVIPRAVEGSPSSVVTGSLDFARDDTPATAFTGPYILDRTHPLTAGLSLDGVVWGAARGPLQGEPVITVGSQPLVAVQGERVRIRFDPSLSNLHRTPAWPALVWNLVEWRLSRRPGPRVANVTLGSDVQIPLAAPVAEVEVVAPDGSRRTADGRSGVVVVNAATAGVWKVGEHAFAANALVPNESDLTKTATGTFGGWTEEALASAGYESAAWILLLLALATLAVHQRVLWSAEARA